MSATLLKRLIKEVEEHTGKPFDLSNKRHFFYLGAKIGRLKEVRLRKLNAIEDIIKAPKDQKFFEVINSATHRPHRIPRG